MSIIVQEIIVSLIIAVAMLWVVRRIINRIRHKNNVSNCNCEGCPLAQGTGCDRKIKNIEDCRKKVDKNVAHSDN